MIEKPINGYSGYFATSTGNVISTLSGKRVILKAHWHATCGRTPYLHVNIICADGKCRKRPLHQLICRAFHGAPPSPLHIVRHYNDDRADNTPGNLLWGTRADNTHDMMRNNPHTASSVIASMNSKRRKYPLDKVRQAYKRWQAGEHIDDICNELGIVKDAIYYHSSRQRKASALLSAERTYVSRRSTQTPTP